MSVGDDPNSPERPRIVLGVSGGIACYKSCSIARNLTEAGASVDVVLTQSATEFVRPVTFEALTGRPVLSSLWEPGGALDHIRWSRDASLVLIAPATAHLLARAAQGLADDFLTTLLLAFTGPVLFAPAMNDEMWAHPITQKNVETLKARGWHMIGPVVGALAEGPSERPGRMVEPDQIATEAFRLIRGTANPFRGKKVLVTGGATRENIDPVRIVTNRSSGRMGLTLAEAAYGRGADVVLVTGPNTLPGPWGVQVIQVETTEQMLQAVEQHIGTSDVVVMAAAPADYRPQESSSEKIARNGGPLSVTLEPTPDILVATRSQRKHPSIIVGFALETGDGVERARAKMEKKGLDLIALNMANESNMPFESETNSVTIISKSSCVDIPRLPKRVVSERILDAIEALL